MVSWLGGSGVQNLQQGSSKEEYCHELLFQLMEHRTGARFLLIFISPKGGEDGDGG